MGILSINSNLSAQAATRRLGQVDARLGSALERLSTGMRINRSSDDPAGLAVASSLETRGRLFGQADRNIRDGLSAIDILDGALGEQSNILIRLAELAEQSANGSLSTTQRAALQIEYQQLQQEFHRVAETAIFNGQKLARSNHGGASSLSLQTGITGAVNSLLSTPLSDSGALSGNIGLSQLPGIGSEWTDFEIFAGTNPTREQIRDRYAFSLRVDLETGGAARDIYLVFFSDGAGTVYVGGLEQVAAGSNGYILTAFQDDKVGMDSVDLTVDAQGRLSRGDYSVQTDSGATLNLDVAALRATNAAQSALDFTGIESIARARVALDVTQARLGELASLRGQVGAAASRLNTSLALTAGNRETNAAALSRLRDVDVAAESSQMVTQQILRQAATAVLAQANQQPALALELLT